MRTIVLCLLLYFTVSWSSYQKTESRRAVSTKKTCFADLSSAAMDVRGKWIQKPSPTPVYGKLSCPMEWSKYACAKSAQSCYRNHTFVITSCVTDHFQFEPLGFLKTLQGRTVAFIGDSLTRQHFISVICHLHHFAFPEMKHQVCCRTHVPFIYHLLPTLLITSPERTVTSMSPLRTTDHLHLIHLPLSLLLQTPTSTFSPSPLHIYSALQVIPWVTERDWPCGAGMCGSVRRGPHR